MMRHRPAPISRFSVRGSVNFPSVIRRSTSCGFFPEKGSAPVAVW